MEETREDGADVAGRTRGGGVAPGGSFDTAEGTAGDDEERKAIYTARGQSGLALTVVTSVPLARVEPRTAAILA